MPTLPTDPHALASLTPTTAAAADAALPADPEADRMVDEAVSVAPAASAADRRSRRRLRELCDEVSASYRFATDGEAFSDADRAEARALLAQAGVPRVGQRTRVRE